MKKSYILWAGTGESFELYTAAMQKYMLMTPQMAGVVLDKKADQATAGKPKSRLLSVESGVGLITVHGVLTSQDNWWNEYAGLVSYNEIRQAALEALASADVKEILLDIASPGGSVAGVKDAVDTLSLVGKTKKITAYTDSQATSAGYWIAAAAAKRYASPVAVLGSIGVVLKHFEYSKMLAEDGITATVIRAGEFKQLANEVEPLSTKGKEALQGSVDHIYGVFVQSVADLLGTSYQQVDSKMAQGREYIGSQAESVGLIDAVASFDQVYAAISKRAAKNEGGSLMQKKYTAQAALAAAAAGVPMEPEAAAGAAAPGEGVPAAAEGTEDGRPKGDGEPAAPAAEGQTVDPTDVAPAPPEAKDSPVEALLKTQLSESQEKLVAQGVELTQLKAQFEGMKAEVDPLKAIVAKTINNMTVALGGTVDDTLASASAKDVIAKHEATVARFVETFPVGGVGSQAPAEPAAASKAKVSPLHAARIKATRPAGK